MSEKYELVLRAKALREAIPNAFKLAGKTQHMVGKNIATQYNQVRQEAMQAFGLKTMPVPEMIAGTSWQDAVVYASQLEAIIQSAFDDDDETLQALTAGGRG